MRIKKLETGEKSGNTKLKLRTKKMLHTLVVGDPQAAKVLITMAERHSIKVVHLQKVLRYKAPNSD